MRILVTGATGMLGQDLVPLLEGHEVRAPRHGEAPLEEEGALERALGDWRPERIFHLAAFTDVDGCERDAERARRSNVTASERVADLAARTASEVVAVSTDYVFDGSAREPIPPTARPAPLNVYGRTKWEGEEAIRRRVARHWIVRTSWLVGPKGRNFVEAIRDRVRAGQPLKVVDDQKGSPTFTFDLAPALVRLPEVAGPGTYHLSNAGICTWYELAAALLRRWGSTVSLARTTTLELTRPALRPAYSVLDNTAAAEALGRGLPHWESALERYEELARQAARV